MATSAIACHSKPGKNHVSEQSNKTPETQRRGYHVLSLSDTICCEGATSIEFNDHNHGVWPDFYSLLYSEDQVAYNSRVSNCDRIVFRDNEAWVSRTDFAGFKKIRPARLYDQKADIMSSVLVIATRTSAENNRRTLEWLIQLSTSWKIYLRKKKYVTQIPP